MTHLLKDHNIKRSSNKQINRALIIHKDFNKHINNLTNKIDNINEISIITNSNKLNTKTSTSYPCNPNMIASIPNNNKKTTEELIMNRYIIKQE